MSTAFWKRRILWQNWKKTLSSIESLSKPKVCQNLQERRNGRVVEVVQDVVFGDHVEVMK
jgi:hypothetical protein